MRCTPVLALTAGLLLTQAAQAVALTAPVAPNPYADTTLGGTTLAARPELQGTVLADVLTPFTFSGVSGTVQSRVVREDVAGTLDFYWKVDVADSTNGLGVSAFRLANFGVDNLQDADWRIDGLGTVSPDAARLFSATAYPAGDLNFLFSGGLAAGSESRFFFLHTNATSYTDLGQFDLLTTGAQNLSGVYGTFAPSAVPEPSGDALMLSGLLAGVVLMRRRGR